MIGNLSELNANNSNIEGQIMIIKWNNQLKYQITRGLKYSRKSIIKYKKYTDN